MKVKVSQLMEILSQFDPDDIVVLQKDPDRNAYSLLAAAWAGVYVGTEDGNAYLRELDSQAIEQGYTEEDLYQGEDGQNAVILYPLDSIRYSED